MAQASTARSKAVSLPLALVLAGRAKGTGALVTSHGDRLRKMWMRAGDPIWIESDDPADAFAAILAFRGVFTEKARRTIEDDYTRPGIFETDAIIASGLLGPSEVLTHATEVFEERLLSAFGLGAAWVFEAGDPPPHIPVVGMPMAEALLRGLRERYGRERLAIEFPLSDGDRYRFEASGLAKYPKLSLSKDEVRLTSKLDGGRGWAAVVTELGIDPDKAHAALYALALLEIVDYVTPTGNTVSAATGAPPVPAPLAEAKPDPKTLLSYGKGREMHALVAKELPDVLGIPPEAAQDAVAAGFKALVGKYDLGRGHWLGEGDREPALALLDRACDAYLVMSHPEARPKYFAAPPWDRETVAAGLAGKFTAEKTYLKAGIFMAAGNHLAAEAALIPAIALAPRDARFHKRMGICIYLRAKSRNERIPAGALRALEKAVALDAKDHESWLYLGHVAVAHGDRKTARDLYQQSLSLNPSSGEARRALMRLE